MFLWAKRHEGECVIRNIYGIMYEHSVKQCSSDNEGNLEINETTINVDD